MEEVRQLLDIEGFYALLDKQQPAQLAMAMNDLSALNMLAPAGDERYTINRMGVLLLAKSISSCAPELASKCMRVLSFKGDGDKCTIDFDETCNRGYAISFVDLVEMVKSQLDNKCPDTEALRHYDGFVPAIVVRELLANAIIHQDFQITGQQLEVRIYADRIVVNNPGKPLMDIDRMIDRLGTRNEFLVDAMRALRICAWASTGIDKAIAAMEKVRGAPIAYRTGDQDDVTEATILATRSYDELSPELQELACYQHCSLRSLNRKTMTNVSFRERFGLDSSKREDVSRLFNKLVDRKLIQRSIPGHSNKHASYVPQWFAEQEKGYVGGG